MKFENHNFAANLIKNTSGFAILLCLYLAFQPAYAETIEVKLPTGITALANFHIGRASQPAVLILHGFLQTLNSPPMSTLSNNLSSKGYTVLSPTISLGVNRRSQSMACEAVHSHTVTTEVAEVDYWVKWLYKKGYKTIVLIGYSSAGNHDILYYNANGPHPAVKKAILISLTPAVVDQAERERTRNELISKQQSNTQKIENFSLSYCKKNFATTASSYMSYAQNDATKILELIKNTPVPTAVILGSADTILPENWASEIKAKSPKSPVTVIDDANHFFDGTTEFDLTEEVEKILQEFHTQSS